MSIKNYLSIDVEDYFQVSAFESVSPRETWTHRASRVEQNTEQILALLESRAVEATFFILGWVAEHYPDVPRKIAGQGHEIASHGHGHQRICNLSRRDFREDVRSSKAFLEDLTGMPVYGYRAPSYSISNDTKWAFDELFEAGYRYDSSIFPIKHDFYGMSDWPRFSGYAVKTEDGTWCASETAMAESRNIRELPITTVKIFGRNLPIAGGGYFRLLPYPVTRWGLRRINLQDRKPFVFYLHPWEFDSRQPRMKNIGYKSRFRHYLNLHKTGERFTQLLDDFEFTSIYQGLCSLQ
jgi:polysaccharide deacetylase family protein (PEP-CTERM system associated)